MMMCGSFLRRKVESVVKWDHVVNTVDLEPAREVVSGDRMAWVELRMAVMTNTVGEGKPRQFEDE